MPVVRMPAAPPPGVPRALGSECGLKVTQGLFASSASPATLVKTVQLAQAEITVEDSTRNVGPLSRAFHKYAGVTIIDYVAHVRLQHARMLLMNTEQRIAGIAMRCGFRESNYFCRWISRHTGLPPSKLRHTMPL